LNTVPRLRQDLENAQDAQNQCNEANIEENDYTMHSIEDIAFDFSAVEQSLKDKHVFIENQVN
jgi:hypothetical protein